MISYFCVDAANVCLCVWPSKHIYRLQYIYIYILLLLLLNLYSHEQNIYKYTQIMQWKTNIKIIYAMFSEKGGEGPKMPLIPDLGE